MAQIFAWYNIPFLLLIGTAFLFLALQFLGGDSEQAGPEGPELHLDTHLDTDFDLHGHEAEAHADLPLLGFLNLGRVPLSLLLMSLCFSWGAAGLLLNTLQRVFFNSYLNWMFVVSFGASAVLAALLTRLSSRGLGALFRENSAASQPDDLVGCVGTLISASAPPAGQSGFGRARIYNEHGVLLQIACVTEAGCLPPSRQQPIFVTGYDESTRLYHVLQYESPDFQAYLTGHHAQMQAFDARLQKSSAHLEAQYEIDQASPESKELNT